MSDNGKLTPFEAMLYEAQALVKSGFLPNAVNSAEKALAIMTMARELGIGMWAAFNGINVIQGKPTISPQLMLGLINKSGQLDNIEITPTEQIAETSSCSVTMWRKGRAPHTETFTMAMAAAMNLSNKDNWRKQPAVMLKWRAIAACARVVFPDVIIGFYTPEEIDPNLIVDEDGVIQDMPSVESHFDATPQGSTEQPRQTSPAKLKLVESLPRDPESVAGDLTRQIDDYLSKRRAADEEYDQKAVGVLAGKLDKICGGSDNRHAVLEYVIGQDTLKGINAAQGWTLMAWADSKHAQAEIDSILYVIGAVSASDVLYGKEEAPF